MRTLSKRTKLVVKPAIVSARSVKTTTAKPPHCDDEVANGEESDVDCGGKDCDPCELGASCTEDSDCDSGVCDEEAELCIEATCEDGELNGRETDVDCGGGCLPLCRGLKLPI